MPELLGHYQLRFVVGTPEPERNEPGMQQTWVIRILDVLLHQRPVARNALAVVTQDRELATIEQPPHQCLGQGNVSDRNSRDIGGLVGYSRNAAITNATLSDKSMVGGVVGNLASGRVGTSCANGSVSAGHSSRVGGLVGMNAGSIRMSSASGKVDFSPAYGQQYEGLIGVNMGQQYLNSVYGAALDVPMIGRNFR
ncbi:GLUG motif-containing protein [Pseudomonas chlororaphis subsp. aurantiaca]|uniref:GLUG motif-containing protein n=1 Tax=Pseudomonas chlororaphis TaxID=587753 RepID=UPI0027DE9449|nr:GLUG motif-containing protein [Pseudomonas chlororaphis]WMI97635.1 GLUG motif-containing protein [Pseudomonas chlororaphis subsp. aurantiaca]